MAPVNYWLLKSEPAEFSIDDLAALNNRVTAWEGLRNFQVRNMLRDGFAHGDQAFFYHSSTLTPGIAGIVEVVRAGYPDSTAFDPASPYYDPKSTPSQPRWYRVDVRLVRKLARLITLGELRQCGKLKGWVLLQRGNRLSIVPVTPRQWRAILELEAHPV